MSIFLDGLNRGNLPGCVWFIARVTGLQDTTFSGTGTARGTGYEENLFGSDFSFFHTTVVL
jgi:hypothetical protein